MVILDWKVTSDTFWKMPQVTIKQKNELEDVSQITVESSQNNWLLTLGSLTVTVMIM